MRLCFLPILLLAGCSSLPHRTIFIVDQRAQPIAHASVGPYPIRLGSRYGNSTDPSGRIELYDVVPGGEYSLSAPGYQGRSIPFPQRDDTIYILKRTP